MILVAPVNLEGAFLSLGDRLSSVGSGVVGVCESVVVAVGCAFVRLSESSFPPSVGISTPTSSLPGTMSI